MQATQLFPDTRRPHSYHRILWRRCSRFDLVRWSRFQRRRRPPRTTALRVLLFLLQFSNNNTPRCSPQGRLSHYFSRYHRATSSPPGCKACALRSLSTQPCLKPLPCVGLRVELPRWSLSVLLWRQRPLLPSRWVVVRHWVSLACPTPRGHVSRFRSLPNQRRTSPVDQPPR